MAAFFKSISANYISKKPLKLLVISGFCRKFEVTTNQFTMTNLQENSIEVWKAVPGYEKVYQVSSLGQIRALDRVIPCKGNKTMVKRGRVLNPTVMKKTGYKFMTFVNHDTKRRQFLMHRIIAKTFHPNPLNLPVVNHKNGIKTDNRIENLEWCTHLHNCMHALENGLSTIPDNKGRFNTWHSKAIMQFDMSGNLLNKFPSASEACRRLNIKCVAAITNAANGRTKTSNSFIWRYTTDPLLRLKQGSLFDSRLM